MVRPVVRAAPWLLLLLGLCFRLWATDHARFTGDESDYWARSRQLAVGAAVPTYGPEITGSEAHLPGPAYYYLMAIPQRLGASPRWGSIFVALLHALAAWLLFRLARHVGGERAGLIALLWIAFAPWDVLYADRIWGSCVVPVWGAVTLYAAVRSSEGTAWQGILLFLCLVLPQLHLSFPVLWVSVGIVCVLRRPIRWSGPALGVGLLLAVLAYGPSILAEFESGFSNTQKIFQHGTGGAAWASAIAAPLKVLVYGVLYASGEIGYHFARGYWGGGFDEAAAYLTTRGLARHFSEHGILLGTGVVVSVLFAASAWVSALAFLARKSDDDHDGLAKALTWALVGGLAAGGVLMLAARKNFFPHYANILMPMLLLPPALAVARALGSNRWRIPILLAFGVSIVSMAVNTVRYYREVDGLNGLGPTLRMVDHVLSGEPAQVRFTHFNNRYAWTMLAKVLHRTPRVHHGGASLTWVVHNRARSDASLRNGDVLFGPVRLERKAAPPGSEARRNWTRFEVSVTKKDGSVQRCVRSRPEERHCRYGDQPWQRFGPEVLQMGGRPRPVLFLHPVQGRIVRARYPLPPGSRTIRLSYGLTDGATRSTNRAPVDVRVLEDGTVIGETRAENRPGLFVATFTRTTTRAAPITLEITAAHEGARVFGFDLEWAP